MWKKLFLCTPLLLTLFLTLSISAWLSFILGLILLSKRFKKLLSNKKIVFLIAAIFFLVPLLLGIWNLKLGISSATSLSRRVFLNQAGVKMWLQHPIFGIGLNQFTAELENIQPSTEVVSFVQPAHHVGILFLAENGTLGVLLVFFLLRNAYLRSLPITNYQLLITIFLLLPLLTLDHYLYTLIQGWWLAIIALLFLAKKPVTW